MGRRILCEQREMYARAGCVPRASACLSGCLTCEPAECLLFVFLPILQADMAFVLVSPSNKLVVTCRSSAAISISQPLLNDAIHCFAQASLDP